MTAGPAPDPRDPHRLAVYRAEDDALPDGGRRFNRFAHVERWVQQVVLGEWWGATFPNAPLEVEITRRSRGATYSATRVLDDQVAVLWLRDGSWQAVTIVHELAHVAAWDRVSAAASTGVGHGTSPGAEPHGIEFTTVLLACWRELLGFHAYGALRSGFDRRNVPYHRDRLR